MKKILLSLFALGLFFTGFSQDNYKKRPTLSVAYVLYDFQTAADIRSSGLSSVIKNKQWHKTKRMNAGLAATYLQGLGSHVDFAATLSGTFLDYPVPSKPLTGKDNLLLELAATANLKLTTDKYWVSPFLTFGLGASKYKGYYSAFIPAGVGLQVNFWDDAYLLINSQYRVPVTENGEYHLFHSLGFAGTLCKKKEPAPVVLPVVPVVEPPKDRDGDGVLDVDDKCPDVKGLASLKGCPDRDGDGIADDDDACPDVAGLAKYKGCPIPDTDKDGINDEQDQCPTVPGLARYKGCPIPDTDKDGVNDEEDKCPNVAGPASNFGCPEIPKAVVDRINIAAKNIFFATGSAKLLAKSFKSLNDVAKIMSEDPAFKLDISGHTDTTGTAAKNQTLSENRAASVLAYLKSKGVDESKMSATGFGQDKPVADNKTAAGRAKNRRVEMVLRNY